MAVSIPIIREILWLLAVLGASLWASVLDAKDESDARGAANSPIQAVPAGDQRGDTSGGKTAGALETRADELQRRYDWSVYGRHIAEAQRAWETGAVEDAWRHLNDCRGDLRGWEHDYLFSLFTKDHRILKTQGRVESVAFSADGQRLVSGYAWVVRTWECATGRELLTFSPRMNAMSRIAAVAFSPDGKRIALGAEGQDAQILDAESGEVLLTRKSAGDHLCFSLDGKSILSNLLWNAPTLWDTSTGKSIRTFAELSESVSLALRPDCKQIASGGDDKLVRIADATTGQVTHTLKGHRGAIHCVAFSPNGRRVASGGGKSIKVWDAGSGKELFTLTGHSKAVSSIAFSPDGRQLVSGSDDALVKLWDVATGRGELRSYKGHRGPVTSVAFSPDGRQLVSGGDDETVRIWELASRDHGLIRILERSGPDFGPNDEPKLSGMTGRIRMWDPFAGKAQDARGEAMSSARRDSRPNGAGVRRRNSASASGSVDSVEARDAASGPVLSALSETGGTFERHAYSVSPDGKQIVVTGGERHGGDLKIFDIASGRVVHTLSENGGPFLHAIFSPDGKWVAGSGFEMIKIWDTASGKLIRTIDGMSRLAMERVAIISSLAISSDGTRLAAGNSQGTIQLLEVSSGRLLVTLSGHVGSVDSVAFSPDGSRIVTTARDALRIWEPNNGQELLTLRAPSEKARQTVFSPDGKHLVSKSNGGRLKFWNAPSRQKVLTLAEYSEPMALSPDGRWLACEGPDGDVQLVDRLSGNAILTFAGESSDCYCLAFSPDGKSIAGGVKGDTLNVWDTDSGKLIREMKGHTHIVGSVAFSPDGQRIVSGSGDLSIRIWEAASGQAIRTITGHWASCVAFSPDGKLIAASNRYSTIRLWNAETGDEVRTISGNEEGYECFAFSPDGRRIASGGHDANVRLWDAETGRELLAMKGHSSFVYGVAFSKDGKWIGSASWDHTAKVWDASTGKEHRSLRQHSAYCSSVAFTPDSRWLVSGSKELKLWDLFGTAAELTD
jgi:WD40 repeat protein